MSIKDLEKPLSCVTHWNSSLLSNRKKSRKGNENVFGISFSDWEKKSIYVRERIKNVLFHVIIFYLDLVVYCFMEWNKQNGKTLGKKTIGTEKII